MIDSPLISTPQRRNTQQQQQFDNQSLTCNSWDKTLFEGLQSKKKNTEEDQALYSYSKLSISDDSARKQSDDIMELKYKLQSNFPLDDEMVLLQINEIIQNKYKPFDDYPQIIKNSKNISTTVTSKEAQKSDETMQELSKRISSDQQIIQNLQHTILQKDNIILQLQRMHNPSPRKNTALLERQNNRFTQQILQLSDTIQVAEEQLSNSLRQQNYLERENMRIKNERMVCEQQQYNLRQKVDHLQEQNELHMMEIQKYKDIVMDQNNNLNRLHLQLKDQCQMIEYQEYQIMQIKAKKVSFTTASTHDIISQRNQIDYSQRNQIYYDNNQMQKFVDCIVDMVQNCQTNNDKVKPSLKKCWNWLKGILEEYMMLKKIENHKFLMKSSQNHDRISMDSTKSEREKQRSINLSEQVSFKQEKNYP